eukprot:TRINITY_DN2559_c0_g1_i1.p1 TRINITY_DN2559_c0_g1~~TRINITY_DN2559_c0_g1_i1.p1  ORF type:complete len:228 (+),score=17.35 TRINITY_DN2559_c0_g1_i1:330-1013(+)
MRMKILASMWVGCNVCVVYASLAYIFTGDGSYYGSAIFAAMFGFLVTLFTTFGGIQFNKEYFMAVVQHDSAQYLFVCFAIISVPPTFVWLAVLCINAVVNIAAFAQGQLFSYLGYNSMTEKISGYAGKITQYSAQAFSFSAQMQLAMMLTLVFNVFTRFNMGSALAGFLYWRFLCHRYVKDPYVHALLSTLGPKCDDLMSRYAPSALLGIYHKLREILRSPIQQYQQ